LKEDYAAAHSNLAAALFALGDYREAWKHVQHCRRHGGTPPPALVDQLSRKAPEPKN
jgi:hypothetical protein